MISQNRKQLTRDENRALNLDEYQNGKVYLESWPRYLSVELTQGCNLRCPMCRPEHITPRERSMDDHIFEELASQLFPLAEIVDLRGWGESLILPDITKRIQTVAEHGAKIRFVTNLAYRRDEVLETVVNYDSYIAVSMDTADPELFKKLRGGAHFDVVSRNLDILLEGFRRNYGDEERVYFTTTVQKPGLKSLPDLIDFAASKGIHEVRMFSVAGDSCSELSLAQGTEEVDEMLQDAAKRSRSQGVKLVAGTSLGSLPQNPLTIPACIHPWAYAYISYAGSVGFCDHLNGPDGEPYLLGNLNDSSFESIWNGREWQELRHEHLNRRDPSAPYFHECSWCYKNRYIDFEHLLDPEAAKRIVKF